MKSIKWFELLATCGGLGRLTSMPGTLTSFAAFGVALVFPVSWWALLAVIAVGWLASDAYARNSGSKDPGEIVIDEVAGTWIAMYGLSPGLGLPALVLFRVLDIVKPFPVGAVERLPGGVGIMADDILAGALANGILRVVVWLFVQGGYASFFG